MQKKDYMEKKLHKKRRDNYIKKRLQRERTIQRKQYREETI